MSLAAAYLLPNRTRNISGFLGLAALASLVLDIHYEKACFHRFARQFSYLKEVLMDHVTTREVLESLACKSSAWT